MWLLERVGGKGYDYWQMCSCGDYFGKVGIAIITRGEWKALTCLVEKGSIGIDVTSWKRDVQYYCCYYRKTLRWLLSLQIRMVGDKLLYPLVIVCHWCGKGKSRCNFWRTEDSLLWLLTKGVFFFLLQCKGDSTVRVMDKGGKALCDYWRKVESLWWLVGRSAVTH